MKKFTLLLLLLTVTLYSASAQQYVQLGIHGGYGSTWMTNNNVSDQGSNLDPQISFAGIGGIHAMASFAPSIGLRLEVNMATIKQKYKGEGAGPGGGNTFEAIDRVKYIEVPVLVLLKSSAFYFEIGPKFSFLNGAKSENTHSNPFITSYKDRDVKAGFKSTVISAVLGLGGDFALTGNLRLTTGLRFAYGFSDATKEYSSTAALLSSPNNAGIATYGAHYDQQGYFSYKATHIATGYLMLGLSYRIPFGK